MSRRLETVLATLFGMIFIALSLLVTVEVLLRKLFGIALEGSFELGGYALAVGSTLAFAVALFGRNHIRIDIVHERLPLKVRGVLNVISTLLMAGLAGLLGFLAWGVITDTLDYQATAQTPWATPLIYPQSVWYAGQVIFMLVAAAIALKALWLLLRGRWQTLDDEFQPKSVKQEVSEEVSDLKTRSALVAGENS